MTDGPSGDLAAIAQLYTESLEKHGAHAKGVGWGDDPTHRLRFQKLAQVIEDPAGAIEVADLGCGYGALFGYLVDTGIDVTRYTGYEISGAMIAEARKRLSTPRIELVLGDRISAPVDYVFASGIFNVRLECDEQTWSSYVLETLANMDAYSRRGWAFNLLTSYVDYREDHLFYGDPAFFFDYCKTRFSHRVALLHDYPLHEWTMIVRK